MLYTPSLELSRIRSNSALIIKVLTITVLLAGGVSAQTVTKSSVEGPTPSGLEPGVSAGSYALSGLGRLALRYLPQ
jgi:hypothetical protein